MRASRSSLGASLLVLSMVALGCTDGGGTTDMDVDGVIAVFDCDDSNPAVGFQVTYYRDADRDGVGGDQSSSWCAASAPTGYAEMTGDCDDDDRSIQDPIDYHVDGDDDGAGSAPTDSFCALAPPAGYAAAADDCNDADPTVQGLVDYFVDRDGDGSGQSLVASFCESSAPLGYSDDEGDCNDADPSVTRPIDYYPDADGDGFGAGDPTASCTASPPANFSVAATDPDDTTAARTPEDRDGDGVPNVDDCLPDDPERYALSTYYQDFDRDTLGTEAVEICEALPAPELDRYSFVGGDDCPSLYNWDEDLDQDGLDDVCDELIHFQTDVEIRDRYYSLTSEYSHPYVPREYRIGSEGNPVELRFTDATAAFQSCALVTLHGGSTLLFQDEAPGYGTTTAFFSNSRYSCKTRIVGERSATEGARNVVRFRGTWLNIEQHLEFDGLDEIAFEPALVELEDGSLREEGNQIHLDTAGYRPTIRTEDQYPIVRNSPSPGGAVVVRDGFVELRGLRFIDNAGYPVECVGQTHRWLQIFTDRRSFRDPCQSAMRDAYFEGNGREGPLVDIVDDGSGARTSSTWYGEAPSARDDRPFEHWGTGVLYVKRLEFLGRVAHYFDYVELRPWVKPDPDHFGPGPAPDVVDPDVEIRFGSTGPVAAHLAAWYSDFSGVPIRMTDSATLQLYDGTRVGPIIAEHRQPPEQPVGPYIGLGAILNRAGVTLDLASSPFVVEVEDPNDVADPVRVGVFLQAETDFDPGHVNVGSDDLLHPTTVRVHDGIDIPILAIGTPRDTQDYDSPVQVGTSVETEGVLREDLVEVIEDGCCREARFILR